VPVNGLTLKRRREGKPIKTKTTVRNYVLTATSLFTIFVFFSSRHDVFFSYSKIQSRALAAAERCRSCVTRGFYYAADVLYPRAYNNNNNIIYGSERWFVATGVRPDRYYSDGLPRWRRIWRPRISDADGFILSCTHCHVCNHMGIRIRCETACELT